MSLLRGVRARIRALLRPGAADRDLADEIAFHAELETEKNIRLGMSPAEARRVAMAHFGGVQRVREEHRDVRRLRWIEELIGDVRFALRTLRRTPVLAAAAVITIALGIGANAAIFSAVNAVVLQPLPFPHSERLVMVAEENPERHWYHQNASTANYLDWRDGVPAFQQLAAYGYSASGMILTGSGDPRKLRAADVTGNFFATLGVRAELGRTLEDAETWSSTPRTAVLSHGAWQREFGADPSVVGRSITLDGDSYQIVGVMPATFMFPFDNLDLWVAERWEASVRQKEMYRRERWMPVIGRLAPGASIATADAQLQQVVKRLQHDYPTTNKLAGASITPLHDFIVGGTRLPLLVLLASVAILLLIACANVGNLMLVQAAGRQREVALRLALGAGRGRVTRQAITESLVVSTIGGALGLTLGWAGTRALVALQPKGLLPVHDFGVDTAVTTYVVAITMFAGLLFGVAPALWTRERDPGEVLKAGARGGTQSRRMKRWGDALVIGEVALALLMTTGAGLLVRSYWTITRVNPGFEPHGVLSASINAYGTITDYTAFFDRVTARVRALPGVTNVALVSVPPFNKFAWSSDFIARGRAPGGYGISVPHYYVSPSYFATMRIPLLRGRSFTEADRRGTAPVILINETLARTYFAGENPIGQSLSFDKAPTDTSHWFTIVGVVGDVHDSALDEAPRIAIYKSTMQSPLSGLTLMVRTTGDPRSLTEPVRSIVRNVDPRLIIAPQAIDDIVDRSIARPRFFAALLLVFAVVGLALSVVGVYAMLAQLARNRTRETGIRIALGAQPAEVRWLLVRHGLRLTVAGLVVGGVGALFATRLLTKLLFGVTPNDPATFAGVAALLAAASLAASWIPAVRASGVDPVLALRAD